MNFARNAASVLLTSFVSIPLAILTSVVLARWLTVGDRGVYSVALTFAGMTVALSQLGWNSASVYRIRRMKSDPAEVLTAGLIATLLIASVVVGGSILFKDVITERLLDDAPSIIFVLALAMIPFQLGGRVINGVAKGIDRFDIVNWTQIISKFGSSTLLFVALVVLDLGVIGALSVMVGLSALLYFGRLFMIIRTTGLSFGSHQAELVDGFRFGLKSWLQSLAGQIHEKVDILMLGWLLTDADVAIYAIAAGLSHYLKLVPEAIGSALFPKLAGLDQDEAGRFAAMVCRTSVIWVLISTLGLATVGPFAIPILYGEAYAPSIWPFLILLPGVGALTIYRILARYFVSLDRQWVTVGTQSSSVVLNLGLNWLLIPRWGVVGAAVASLASYSLEAIIIAVFFRRDSGQKLSNTFICSWSELTERLEQLRARLRQRKSS